MKTLSHIAKNKFGKWVGTKPNPHPVVIVGVSVSGDSYEQLEIPEPSSHEPTNVQAVADTGAMVLVGGLDLVHQLRVKKHELIPVSHRVRGVNNGQLELIGGLLVDISLGDRNHQELCYIAKDVKGLFLSGATMKALGIISENFPEASPAENDPQQPSCLWPPTVRAQPQMYQQHQQPLNMMIGVPWPSHQFPIGPVFPAGSGHSHQLVGTYGQQRVASEARFALPAGEDGRRDINTPNQLVYGSQLSHPQL